jgi:hypothetical protein
MASKLGLKLKAMLHLGLKLKAMLHLGLYFNYAT